jgi:hypothetical protein
MDDQCTDGWFLTASGNRYYPTSPRPEDVNIRDIAHALSNICRFGGHCRWFYSVGQHAVLGTRWLQWVKNITNPLVLLQFLGHDNTEAYVGDVVRPLKVQLVGYADIEARNATAIAAALGIPEPDEPTHELIKLADNTMLMTERRDLLGAPGPWWSNEPAPWDRVIKEWSPYRTRNEFLKLFFELKDAYDVIKAA